MTPSPSVAETGGGSISAPGCHAYVENGTVVVKVFGRWEADNWMAWLCWLEALPSPIPSTQERAREIRAALDQVQYLRAA